MAWYWAGGLGRGVQEAEVEGQDVGTEEGKGPRLPCPTGWRVWGDPLTPHIPRHWQDPQQAQAPGCRVGVRVGDFQSWGLSQQSPPSPLPYRGCGPALCTRPVQNLVHRPPGPKGLWVPRTRARYFLRGLRKPLSPQSYRLCPRP